MTAFNVIHFYFTWQCLLALGFLFLAIFPVTEKLIGKANFITSNHRLRLAWHYRVFLLVLLVSIASIFFPKHEIFQPFVKVVPQESVIPALPASVQNTSVSLLSSPFQKEPIPISQSLYLCFNCAGLMLLFVLLIKFIMHLKKLSQIKDQSHPLREIGSIFIGIHSDLDVPMSYRLGRKKVVILPQIILAQNNWRLAVQHELQHHRQGDTAWIFLIWFAQWLCWVNPLFWLWKKKTMELQELACDQAVLAKAGTDTQAYARCLFQVAKTALNRKFHPACATGMAFFDEGPILKRRIQMILQNNKPIQSRPLANAISVLLLTILLSASAFAMQNLMRDRRISMGQAEALAAVARNGSDFPISLNPEVLHWLNHFLGTPESRLKVKAALARMESFRPEIERSLAQYNMPKELLAIPLIESGFQNLEASQNGMHSAGLWQFIASTAKHYGLQVNADTDERLNVALETDAAMRYLLGNKLRFKDWQLSILSYNSGENAVQAAMDRLSTRDPWRLVREGLSSEENSSYLPKLIAAILILKNPDIL